MHLLVSVTLCVTVYTLQKQKRLEPSISLDIPTLLEQGMRESNCIEFPNLLINKGHFDVLKVLQVLHFNTESPL